MKRFFRLFTTVFLLQAMIFLQPAHSADLSRIILLGDFLPSGRAEPVINQRGFGYLFGGVRSILDESDAVFLNLEAPLSRQGSAREGKKFTFSASPSAAGGMFEAGVGVVSLANNHILDFGPLALADTILNLDSAGIAHTGAGADIAQAAVPAVLDLPSGPVRFLAFSNTFPEDYWAGKSRPGTLFGAPATVRKAVSAAAGESAVVVSFHWGEEMMEEPKDYQVELARLAIDNGADIVVGHHPHVTQPVEIYRGRPILYSLGNFAFGSYGRRTSNGLMARVSLDSQGICHELEVYPLLVNNLQVAFRPKMLGGEEGREAFERLAERISPDLAFVRWEGNRGVIVPRNAHP